MPRNPISRVGERFPSLLNTSRDSWGKPALHRAAPAPGSCFSFLLLWLLPNTLDATTLLPSAGKDHPLQAKPVAAFPGGWGDVLLSRTKQLQAVPRPSCHWPVPFFLESVTVVSLSWAPTSCRIPCPVMLSFPSYPLLSNSLPIPKFPVQVLHRASHNQNGLLL